MGWSGTLELPAKKAFWRRTAASRRFRQGAGGRGTPGTDVFYGNVLGHRSRAFDRRPRAGGIKPDDHVGDGRRGLPGLHGHRRGQSISRRLAPGSPRAHLGYPKVRRRVETRTRAMVQDQPVGRRRLYLHQRADAVRHSLNRERGGSSCLNRRRQSG